MVSEALWDAGGEVEGEGKGVFEVEGGGWVVSFYFTLRNDISPLSLRRADVLLGRYSELIISFSSSGNLSAIS